MNYHPKHRIPLTADKFWDKLIPIPECGCMIWDGATEGAGYGVLKINNNQIKAHRHAWQLTKGEIPKKLFVLHKCDIRLCCNPNHLFLGTQKDNIKDMMNKGRGKGQKVIGWSKL